MQSVKKIRTIVASLAIFFSSIVSAGQESRRVCGEISEIFKSGKHRQYSVSYEDPIESESLGYQHEITYVVDLDGDGKKERMTRTCADSNIDNPCAFKAILSTGKQVEFTSNNLFFIRLKKSLYLVGGVTVAKSGASFNGFSVQKIVGSAPTAICKS